MKICRVETKREVVDTGYEVCGNEYCCEKMKQWLKIDTRSRHHLRYDIDKCRFEIEVREDAGSYSCHSNDDSDRAAYEDLDFCPFCGTRLQATQPKTMAVELPKNMKKKFLRRRK